MRITHAALRDLIAFVQHRNGRDALPPALRQGFGLGIAKRAIRVPSVNDEQHEVRLPEFSAGLFKARGPEAGLVVEAGRVAQQDWPDGQQLHRLPYGVGRGAALAGDNRHRLAGNGVQQA